MRMRAWAIVVLGIAAGCNSLTGAADVSVVEPAVEDDRDASTGGEVIPEEDGAEPPKKDASPERLDAGSGDADAEAGPRGPLRAFVTSQTWNGSLGGLAGADLKCKQAAEAAALGGTGVWVAWASTNQDNVRALDRITSNGPWQLVDGTVLATDKADLVDGMMNPALRRTEQNQVIDALNDRTWTGTRPDGTPGQNDCARWTSASSNSSGLVGEANRTNGDWSNLGPEPCNNVNRLYCFEL